MSRQTSESLFSLAFDLSIIVMITAIEFLRQTETEYGVQIQNATPSTSFDRTQDKPLRTVGGEFDFDNPDIEPEHTGEIVSPLTAWLDPATIDTDHKETESKEVIAKLLYCWIAGLLISADGI